MSPATRCLIWVLSTYLACALGGKMMIEVFTVEALDGWLLLEIAVLLMCIYAVALLTRLMTHVIEDADKWKEARKWQSNPPRL